ncbi:3-phenylpropionate/trans-cinnamate dioxygenase ferredoxin reductase component [Frankia sp. AiPs1]|uniref:NAD(P)/FAD-dependent oxidoreductase n=1 Tax=Frankia sp. AiPa1 TaxID=573492 RepID=UPI00202B6F7A|nr:FAD-dependent oxidoreductase [Frankia sp. AiPa1]MCL9762337.1 FAD-dependent oxidoreductase [Frankia sp. AiPa1]
MQRIVIVGAGMAGGRAAVELRRRGFEGDVVLVGAEAHLPYDRPPLSKAVLTGRSDDTTLPLALDGVEVITGRRATGLRPGTIETDAGPLAYDGLVLATGSDPIPLPGDGPVRVLRTIDDARGLRAALRPGLRLVIVGAGWIGAEVATTAVAAGAEVTVVEAADTPLRAALGPEIGARTIDWYARAGVKLRLGVSVERTTAAGLELTGGELLPADEILVGIGARPDLGWLENSGLALDRGIVVDEYLAARWSGAKGGASDGPPVVAVGDCAAWWSRRYGQRLRVEHWDCAQHSPSVAAVTLLRAAGLGADATGDGGPDGPAQAPVYDPVPYFWSEQFGRMIQYAGRGGPDDELVWRGDPSEPPLPEGTRPPGWSAGWFAPDGQLRALVTVGRPMDMAAGRRLMLAGGGVDQKRFSDLSVTMKELVAAG